MRTPALPKSPLPQRPLSLLAPALLVLVACVQGTLVRTQHLTAWKGGGFGMFSTFDSPGARTLRVLLLTPEGEALVAFPDLEVDRRRLLNMPDDGVLLDLAERTGSGDWLVYTFDQLVRMGGDLPAPFRRQLARAEVARRAAMSESDTAVRRDPYPQRVAFAAGEGPEGFEGESPEVWGVRAEVWGLRFDPVADRLHARLVTSATVDLRRAE